MSYIPHTTIPTKNFYVLSTQFKSINPSGITKRCIHVFSKFISSLHKVNFDAETQLELLSLNICIETKVRLSLPQFLLNLIHSSFMENPITLEKLNTQLLKSISTPMLFQIQQLLVQIKLQVQFNQIIHIICIQQTPQKYKFCLVRSQDHEGIPFSTILNFRRKCIQGETFKPQLIRLIQVCQQHKICFEPPILQNFEIQVETQTLNIGLDVDVRRIVKLQDIQEEIRIIWMIQLQIHPCFAKLFKSNLRTYFEPDHRLEYFLELVESTPGILKRCFPKNSIRDLRTLILYQLKD